MIKALLIGGLAALAPMTAFADGGTCASPAPLASMASDNGSTCGGEIGINMGGTVYGHPSKVYSFHINPTGPDGTPTTIALTGSNREASVTTSCTTAPTLAGAPGAPIDVSGLAEGDYLLVVSTDPGLPVTDPPTCGDFGVQAGVLPVTVTNFSVE